MATNPIPRMTVQQLKEQLAMYQDMVNMMNSGASGSEISAKYGQHPDSTREAMVTVNSLKAELIKRGEIVEGGSVYQEYSWKKNIMYIAGTAVVIVVILALVGKIKSLKL